MATQSRGCGNGVGGAGVRAPTGQPLHTPCHGATVGAFLRTLPQRESVTTVHLRGKDRSQACQPCHLACQPSPHPPASRHHRHLADERRLVHVAFLQELSTVSAAGPEVAQMPRRERRAVTAGVSTAGPGRGRRRLHHPGCARLPTRDARTTHRSPPIPLPTASRPAQGASRPTLQTSWRSPLPPSPPSLPQATFPSLLAAAAPVVGICGTCPPPLQLCPAAWCPEHQWLSPGLACRQQEWHLGL